MMLIEFASWPSFEAPRLSISTALRIGASGFLSSWASIARNSSLRRSASRSSSSIRFRSVMSRTTLTNPQGAPPSSSKGRTIPLPQTSVPVQLHQALGAFDAPARESLRRTLDETATGLSGGGAEGLRTLAPHLAPVLRDTAWIAQASLGRRPHDLSGLVQATDRLARGLDRGPVLGDLVGNLATTTAALHDRDRQHVFLEGGPELAAAFLRAELVDEVVAYVAPAFLGAGTSAVADLGISTIADARRMLITGVTTVGSGAEATVRITMTPSRGGLETLADDRSSTSEGSTTEKRI